uniref:PA domain-containing protein n=1 Tax=Odontella aurita TaxID=265563 RepID=A0A7S4JDJ8_9STRA|mmetsp:Transcript_4433/g.12363  ORF Transcript_4433/g.12363 Transcript_4433/m.12363 type:complete len:523 (+) Transcript_4433:154-1722(+)
MKMYSTAALFAASALLASPNAFSMANDDNVRVSSLLQIHIPHNFTKLNGYKHKEALFGIPRYGGSIRQNVYYADSDLCDANVDTSKGYPERKGKDGKNVPWPTPFILMVDRGYCTFVAKVRNAQRVGASGVIVADNTCVCGDSKCPPTPGSECESREPIMADDGSGSDISIPSFLMAKEDANVVKELLKAKQPVQMEMAWALPSPDNHVRYELWTTPSTRIGKNFPRQFKEAAVALGEHASFQPYMYIYDGQASGCIGLDGSNQCYNLCTNNGRYCATDPDNNLDYGVSGADVVKESLRRMCVWEHYGKDGIGVQWWDYVREFTHRCDTEDDPEYFKDDICVRDAMAHSGVDFDRIESCIGDSGGLDDDKDNGRLKDLLTKKDDRGIVILPSAFVNGSPLRGELSFSVMFKAICAGYLEGTEPDVCARCAFCPDERMCVTNGYCYGDDRDGVMPKDAVSNRTFKVTLLAVVALFVGLGVIYRRKQRQELRDQVRDVLASYMLLDEDDETAGRVVGRVAGVGV